MTGNRVQGKRIISLLKATRPVNQFISVMAVLAGWIISTDEVIPDPEMGLFLLMISVFCTSGGVNLLNDIGDLSIDRRAHPDRAVASGVLSATAARYISFSLLFFGFSTALSASIISGKPLPILIFTCVLIIDLIYEKWTKQKGLPGNIMVSAIVGISFPFGASIHGINATVMVIFSVAFLANLSRELIKDVEDLHGDRENRSTLPMSYGERKTLLLSSVILFTAILAGLTILLFRDPHQIFAIALTFVNLILFSAIWTTYKNTSRAQILIKIGMALAVFSFILLPIG